MENCYTTLDDAVFEIRNRWNDTAIKKKVEEYLKNDIPEVFLDEPRAVLFRNIASPDFEMLCFLELSKKSGLKPLILEYLDDKFSTRNADKLCLVKMAIFEKKNSKGESIVCYKKIIDIKANDNKRFGEIETVGKKNLIDFHHDLVNKIVPGGVDIFDMSEWISRNGKNAVEYYKQFLALFICHGILFENFVTDESEAGFAKRAVSPAIENAKTAFSTNPLISQLASNPNDIYWWSYPNEIKDLLH